MIRYLFDTNICIHVIRKRAPHVLDRMIAAPARSLGLSSIALAELEYGVEKSSDPQRNAAALRGFLGVFQVIAFDDEAAKHYGNIRAGLERAGETIGALDLLIAGHARALGVTLVTDNTREFQRVPDLKTENWLRR
jgi:tRNA(fMet)-specific endonuclease VapC